MPPRSAVHDRVPTSPPDGSWPRPGAIAAAEHHGCAEPPWRTGIWIRDFIQAEKCLPESVGCVGRIRCVPNERRLDQIAGNTTRGSAEPVRTLVLSAWAAIELFTLTDASVVTP